MIERVVSGGQAGADRGGLDAAIELGIPHGGWCPKGRRAEDGTIPARYQLRELDDWSYQARTDRNVMDSDGTVIFTTWEGTPGSARTWRVATAWGKRCLRVPLKTVELDEAAIVALGNGVGAWAATGDRPVRVLNVAGTRESKLPGIQELVRRAMIAALRWRPW